MERIRTAIGAANLAAGGRGSPDSLWSSPGELVASEVRSELAKGDLMPSEVRRWFADLEGALAGLDVVVAALDPGGDRVPNLDSWLTLPPSVTAFLTFTAEVDGRRRTTPRRTVEETADALATWTRLPGATTVVSRGATSFVVPSSTAADELRTSASLDEQHALWHVTKEPRRARLVDFTFRAKGSLQVVDANRSAVACLPDLLSGLRTLAPYVEYAWVRRGLTTCPDERDTVDALGHPTTEVEELAAGRQVLHLLRDYAVDAYVAQVLTSAHLARTGASLTTASNQWVEIVTSSSRATPRRGSPASTPTPRCWSVRVVGSTAPCSPPTSSRRTGRRDEADHNRQRLGPPRDVYDR